MALVATAIYIAALFGAGLWFIHKERSEQACEVTESTSQSGSKRKEVDRPDKRDKKQEKVAMSLT